MALCWALLVPFGIWRFGWIRPLAALGRRHLNPMLAIGRKDAMETREVDPRLAYQCGQFGNEVWWFKDDVSRAIATWVFELVTNLAVMGQCKTLF